ncbi:ribokinase [Tuberibacillus sp. Marseille-P3662]|uniref:ribokinase n=1 Tax=Tuberibacillus sp. Marseille-P3662 TaxID=1965358 RepID=UPI0020CAA62D|nr:ribokinase [Tuberibacillus sp. Marseille-P3662]
MNPKVTVIGSMNMDLVAETERRPEPGETVLGEQFTMNPGGKGFNQAVAAARLGADVQMIGRVGDDAFGREIISHLAKEGMSTNHVEQVTDTSTGTATIVVSEGENNIVVVPGANHRLSPEDLENVEPTIADSDIVLLQLETPMDTVTAAARVARRHHVPVILNPAPYQALPTALVHQIDYLTPNEHEHRLMHHDALLDHFDNPLIVTKGSAGTDVYNHGKGSTVQGYTVDPIDTTGAGDAFNGGLAARLASGSSLTEAVRYANAVGARAVTKLGAQSGMPTHQEVLQLMDEMD